ncbi:MAG: hypothetical protein FD143_2845 [Ignavibacteria bacterium]|nr:MAG: hypothetical protein FD143_2845 [Ignavibacteria bacterium]
MENLNKMNECYSCQHKREVPGDAHIQCVKPDAFMQGNKHGIAKGWFMYPLLFDPVWKLNRCNNFENSESNESSSQSYNATNETNAQ